MKNKLRNKISIVLILSLLLSNFLNILPASLAYKNQKIDVTSSSTPENVDNDIHISTKNMSAKLNVRYDGKVRIEGYTRFKKLNIPIEIRDKKSNKIVYLDEIVSDDNGKINLETNLELNREFEGKIFVAGETANFEFKTNSLKPKKGKIYLRVEGKKNNILETVEVDIEDNETELLEGIVKGLKENNIKYSISGKNLIDEIDGEKDWQWMINNIGGMYNDKYKLKDGDSVVLIDGLIMDPEITNFKVIDKPEMVGDNLKVQFIKHVLVKDNQTGKTEEKPMKNKNVLVNDEIVKTDDNGYIDLKIENPGEYIIKAEPKENYIRPEMIKLYVKPKEETIEKLRIPKLSDREGKEITLSVEKFTLGQGYIIEPQKYEIKENEKYSYVNTRFIEDNLGSNSYNHTGSLNSGFYLSSIKDNSSDLELNVPNYIMNLLEDGLGTRKRDGWLGEFDYNKHSGWMYSVNNEFPQIGMSNYNAKNGDVARIQFTLANLGGDLGSDFMSLGPVDIKIANRDRLTNIIAEINSSPYKDKLLEDKNISKLYEDANKKLTDLTSSQIEIDKIDYNLILSLNKWLEDNNKLNIDKKDLEEKIKEIENTDLSVYTNESVKKLLDIKNKSEKVLNDENATQKDIDDILEELNKAFHNLETIYVDTTKLEEKLEIAKNIDSSLYKESSINELKEKVEEVVEYLDNEKKTQKDINRLLEELNYILNNLEYEETDKDNWKLHLKSTLDRTYSNLKNPSFGVSDGEWSVLGLARSNYNIGENVKNIYYNNVMNKLLETNGNLHDVKYTEYSRLILSLTSLGYDVKNVAGYNQIEKITDYDKVIKQGLNGPIFALIALNSGNYSEDYKDIESKYIEYILRKESPKNGWGLIQSNPDVDITAMSIQALAPYYGKRNDVTDAIDRALDWLEYKQEPSGAYKSAWGDINLESTAQVLVALTSINKDPLKDKRFISSAGNTVIDGIMDYAIKGGGFSHIKGEGLDFMATDQGTYALIAYDRYLDKNKTNLYDMTDVKLNRENPDIVIRNLQNDENFNEDRIEIKVDRLSDSDKGFIIYLNNQKLDGKVGKNILKLKNGKNKIKFKDGDYVIEYTVNVDMKDKDTENKEPEKPTESLEYIDVTLSIDKFTIDKGYVIRPKKLKIPKGDSVWDVLKYELDKNKIPYDYNWTPKYGSVYVESIDGDGEFDHGEGSGWMYNVNGWYPNYGASKYILKDGDKIEWRYTTDLGADLGEDITDWDDSNDDSKPNIDNPDNEEKTIIKKQEVLDRVSKNKPIIVKDKNVTVLISPNDLKNIKDDIIIEISSSNSYKINVRTKSDNIPIKSKIKIKTDKRDIDNKFTMVLNNKINLGGLYNKEAKEYVFITDQYGHFEFNKKNVDFKDLMSHEWAKDTIKLLGRKGIALGIGEGKFEPNGNITRAQFVTLINRIFSLKANSEKELKFDDVNESHWYYEDIKVAYSNNIIDGRDDSIFDPESYITREEMAKIVSRAFEIYDLNKNNNLILENYKDNKNISNWAKDYVSDLLNNKILIGDDERKINPKDNATRAEASMVIYRAYKLILFK